MSLLAKSQKILVFKKLKSLDHVLLAIKTQNFIIGMRLLWR
jgi:hypothetical protein